MFYGICSYSLLLIGSEAQDVQRIKNPPNPKNSDLEGIGVLNCPDKTSFFLFGGVSVYIEFSHLRTISPFIIELSCHYKDGINQYNYIWKWTVSA